MHVLTLKSSGFSNAGMRNLSVFFDGSRPSFSGELAFMGWPDQRGAITFHDVSPSDAICPLDHQPFLTRFPASENCVILSGTEARAAMWLAISLLRPLGSAARRQAISAIIKRAYIRFLQVRPRLQQVVLLR